MPPPRQCEQEAVALADGLRVLLHRWFRRRGVRDAPSFGVSPYVTKAGEPAVVIRMDAYSAHALLHTLDEHHRASEVP
ncbi:MAG TPA: hypothetical protein VF069_16120 [Streptosporangiaceae bacterium]